MSDETIGTDGWATREPVSSTTETQPTPGERVGFCQNCGRPLTQDTVRAVGSGVFCEPCLEARIGYTGPAASAIPPVAPGVPRETSPAVAATLGLIPGVGAMYNGQYSKGFLHLIVFAVLMSLEDSVHGIFGLVAFGWWCYQIFDAYETAKALRDGLPLPNPFGFNDIGERLGFGRTWGVVAPAKPGGAPPAAPPPPAATATGYVPTGTIPVGTAPDWVGYVPPTAFGAAAVPPQATQQANQNSGYSHAPYSETYAGAPAYASAIQTVQPPTRRFPVGAIWLIGLGALILIGNLLPDWRLSGRWLLPVLFAGLSIWTLTRRLRSGVSIVCLLRWPVILMVLAVLFTLQAAYIATFGQTWPILFIALGAVLLLERTAGAGPAYIPQSPSYAVPPAGYPGPSYSSTSSTEIVPAGEAPARAAWTEPAPHTPSDNAPSNSKDGL